MITIGTPSAPTSSRGRGYLWLGLGVPILGVLLGVVQYALKQLIIPWYGPVLSTLRLAALLLAIARRTTVVRIIALLFVVALTGFEWYFLLSMSRVPSYTGPARPGQPMPAFQTQ